jgi:YVTN family beta-propeller protein
MSPQRMTVLGAALRWRVTLAVLISVTAGLGSIVPMTSAVAAAASMADSSASRAGPSSMVTAYVTNGGSDTVTPIAAATNTAGPPITTGPGPDAVAITPDGKTAYVVNGNSGSPTVTPIATATNTAGRPIPVGSDPCDIAITPDGKTVYVVNSFSDTVTPIATATNTAGPPIRVGHAPDAVAITPDGKTAYVATVNYGSPNRPARPGNYGSPSRPARPGAGYPSGSVTPIATATNTAGPPIPAGDLPISMAITPDGKTAYVANFSSGTVTPIATGTNTAGPPIRTGSNPFDIAITPDGKTAYVANGTVPGTVTPIATATNTAGPAIRTGSGPGAIVITPDGRTAYVANGTVPGTVTPIATGTNTAGPPIRTGDDPSDIAITPDGKTAYVVNGESGTVTPIATATNTAGPPIPVGNDPGDIAITPAAGTQGPAFTSRSATVAAFGAAFTFTVTSAGDPAPSITGTGRLPSGVRFAAGRGGTATISGTPAKAAAGVYRLTLTARNKYGTATQAFTLTITRAPAIGKIPTIRGSVGAVLRLAVRATGYLAPALAESGPLPRGLSLTDKGDGTAIIAGTPAAGSGGRYPITVTAANASGTATRHFTIIVSRDRARPASGPRWAARNQSTGGQPPPGPKRAAGDGALGIRNIGAAAQRARSPGP